MSFVKEIFEEVTEEEKRVTYKREQAKIIDSIRMLGESLMLSTDGAPIFCCDCLDDCLDPPNLFILDEHDEMVCAECKKKTELSPKVESWETVHICSERDPHISVEVSGETFTTLLLSKEADLMEEVEYLKERTEKQVLHDLHHPLQEWSLRAPDVALSDVRVIFAEPYLILIGGFVEAVLWADVKTIKDWFKIARDPDHLQTKMMFPNLYAPSARTRTAYVCAVLSRIKELLEEEEKE